MKLTYFENKHPTPLVEQYYELSLDKKSVPFKSTILPLGFTNINYNFSSDFVAVVNGKKIGLNGLKVSGQFFRSYEFTADTRGMSFGMSMHPTAIHKILGIDISKFENGFIPLKRINHTYFDKLNDIFQNYKTADLAIKDITEFLGQMTLFSNKNIDLVDKVIALIREKEGLLNMGQMLKEVSVSQKTLETQFKQIVGLTPGKYARLYRFVKLMRKYENQQINLKDLIHMYDYYDRSHFSRDFKLFTHESPRVYFNKDYELVKETLKK